MTDWWWAYLGLGVFVGFFSGLLGIGGGSAIVPVLAFILAAKSVAPEHVVHLALGTAVASIFFTSASSVRSHHARKAVNWRLLRALVPGVLAGTFGGALLAGELDVRVLSIAFTLFMYYLAAQMLRSGRPEPSSILPGNAALRAIGAAIGFLASLSATAGASLLVPFLVKRNISVHEAIGTAAAVGWAVAVAGTAGYVIAGWGLPDMPRYSVGYVYLPALAGIVIASVLSAPLGAACAHRTSGAALKKVLAVVLFALATGMLLKFL